MEGVCWQNSDCHAVKQEFHSAVRREQSKYWLWFGVQLKTANFTLEIHPTKTIDKSKSIGLSVLYKGGYILIFIIKFEAEVVFLFFFQIQSISSKLIEIIAWMEREK